MKSTQPFLIIFLSICIIGNLQCGNEPEEAKLPMPNVSAITFGTTWNQIDCTLSDTGRVFSPNTRIVYYEIAFDSVLASGCMFKNIWIRGADSLLSSVSLIASGTKRICGEFHKYDSVETMGLGIYQLSIKYLDSAYVDMACSTSVDRTFTIQ